MTSPVTTYTRRDLTRLLVDIIAGRGSVKDMSVCVQAGADTNWAYRKGLKPLHYAAFEDFVEAVEYLIDEGGADVNIEDDLGYTPLHIASKHGHCRSVKALLKRGAIVNFTENDSAGSETARALASLTINPLSLAIENNEHECVELLLKYGANANQDYFLGHEVNLVPMEYTRCLELLLEYGANADVFSRGGISPLMKACKNKRPESVKALIKNGASVNLRCPPKFDQKTALHFAAASGNIEIVHALLQAGASTSKSEQYDHTPLEFAVIADHPEVVDMLLQFDADPNEVNEERCSVLQTTVSTIGLKHQKEIIEILLCHGANPNHHSQYFSYMGPSLSPLLEYFGYMDEYDISIIKLFLTYGSSVNMTRPTRLLRIRDAAGMLGQVRKLRPHEEIFQLLINATDKFDIDSIPNESSLSNRQKEILLEYGSTPRDLRHLTRLALRKLLPCPIPARIHLLPLPQFLKEYLLFKV